MWKNQSGMYAPPPAMFAPPNDYNYQTKIISPSDQDRPPSTKTPCDPNESKKLGTPTTPLNQVRSPLVTSQTAPVQYTDNSNMSFSQEHDDEASMMSDEMSSPKLSAKSGSMDILNKIADMSNDESRKDFVLKLQRIWEENTIVCRTMPTVNKQALDLFKLYTIVRQRGGFAEITKNKAWKDVSSVMELGNSAPIALNLKRKYASCGLVHYECKYDLNGADPRPMLADCEKPTAKPKKTESELNNSSSTPAKSKAKPKPKEKKDTKNETTGTPLNASPASTPQYNPQCQQAQQAQQPQQAQQQQPQQQQQQQQQQHHHHHPQQHQQPAQPPQSQLNPHYDYNQNHAYPQYYAQPRAPYPYQPYAQQQNMMRYPPPPPPPQPQSTSAAPQSTTVNQNQPMMPPPQPSMHPQMQYPMQYNANQMGQQQMTYAPVPYAQPNQHNHQQVQQAQVPPQPQQQAPTSVMPQQQSVPPAPMQQLPPMQQQQQQQQQQPPPMLQSTMPIHPTSVVQNHQILSSKLSSSPSPLVSLNQMNQNLGQQHPQAQINRGVNMHHHANQPYSISQPHLAQSSHVQQAVPVHIQQQSQQMHQQQHHHQQQMQTVQTSLSNLKYKAREQMFPADCVESTVPVESKKRKLCAKDITPLDPWKLYMSLKSGLLAESTWALDALNILLFDDQTISYFHLSHFPGLVSILLEHFVISLKALFDEFRTIQVEPDASSDSVENDSQLVNGHHSTDQIQDTRFANHYKKINLKLNDYKANYEWFEYNRELIDSYSNQPKQQTNNGNEIEIGGKKLKINNNQSIDRNYFQINFSNKNWSLNEKKLFFGNFYSHFKNDNKNQKMTTANLSNKQNESLVVK